MKTTNRYFQFFSLGFLSVWLLFLVACGGGGGSNNNPTPAVVVNPYGYQNCINCQNTGPTFFTAESVDYTGLLRLSWSFSSGQATIAQTNPYNYGYGGGYNYGFGMGSGNMTPGSYYGSVSSTGQMTLAQPMNLGYCSIPGGTYTLSTYQAGQWAYGIVSNLTMQAYGPANLQISFLGQVSSPGYLSGSQLSSSTNSVGRMFGNLRIESVNGQICQQVIGIQ